MIFQKLCSKMSGFQPPFPPLSSTSFIFCLQQMGPIFPEMESMLLAGDYGLSILIVVVVLSLSFKTLPTSKNCSRSFSWIQQSLSTRLKCKNFLTEDIVIICKPYCHTSHLELFLLGAQLVLDKYFGSKDKWVWVSHKSPLCCLFVLYPLVRLSSFSGAWPQLVDGFVGYSLFI